MNWPYVVFEARRPDVVPEFYWVAAVATVVQLLRTQQFTSVCSVVQSYGAS